MGESWSRSRVQTERSEVCTHDRRQESSHTDRLSSVNKMFIMWQTRNKIIRLMLLVCTNWHFACERRWKKFARLLYFFLSSVFLSPPLIFLEENSQQFGGVFTARCNRSRYRSRWENLHRAQYRFQPIKFVKLVVPSPVPRHSHIIKQNNIKCQIVLPFHFYVFLLHFEFVIALISALQQSLLDYALHVIF